MNVVTLFFYNNLEIRATYFIYAGVKAARIWIEWSPLYSQLMIILNLCFNTTVLDGMVLPSAHTKHTVNRCVIVLLQIPGMPFHDQREVDFNYAPQALHEGLTYAPFRIGGHLRFARA